MLVESSSNEDAPLSEKSVERLREISEIFFKATADIGQFSGAKDWTGVSSLLERGCKENNIRYVG